MTPIGYGQPPAGGGYGPPGVPPGGGGYGPPGGGGYGPPGGGGYGPPGGPMGGPPMGAAYQPPKKGPPTALLVGGGCGLVAVIGVVLLIALVVVGRSSSGGGSSGEPAGDTPVARAPSGDDDPHAMDGAVYKGIPSTNVEVPIPPGWREDRKSLYSFALSGDGDAVLAFTTVSSIGEFSGRLQHATNAFNITSCSMQDAVRVALGPNRLRARLKEGSCSFNNVPSHVAVVLVETGQNALPLVIYAVDLKAPRRTVTQAQQTIGQMRSR